MARNPDRFSIQAQLDTADSNLESAKAEHARQALRLAQFPNDADTQRAVAELEVEVERHRLTISRLKAAQTADHQQAYQQKEAERIASVKALCAKVNTITDQLDPLLVRIVKGLEAVGPDLAEFVTLAAQRQQAAHAAARLACKGKPVPAIVANAVRADGHGALINALVGGVVRAGICTVGPSLAPHLIINATVRVPTLAAAQQLLDRERCRLGEAIEIINQPESSQEEQYA